MLTLRQIQTFYWVCRAGTFGAAAERMNSTQSGVSQRIHELEQALGADLFERVGRNARLTAKGRRLLRYAEQLMQLCTELEQEIGDPQALSGTVRLGVSDLIAVTWLPQLVSSIRDKFPNLDLELEVALGPNIQDRIDSGAVDLVLLGAPNLGADSASLYLGHVAFAWMASPQLGAPRRMKPCQLAEWPILALSNRSHSHRLVARWLARNDVTMNRVHICNNIQVLITLTVSGLGIGLLPVDFVQSHVDREELCVLNVSPALPDIEYRAVWDRRQASAPARAIAELAGKCCSFKRKRGFS